MKQLILTALLALLLPVAGAGQVDSTGPSIEQSSSKSLNASDWSSIREAFEVGRHGVYETGGVHCARNPGQRWTTVFDGLGFTTTPDAAGWSWGLELTSYGRAESRRTVAAPHSVTTAGSRVSYHWDDLLTEWYINDSRGLEHGYTLHSRPDGAARELTLDLVVRGDLAGIVSDNGRDVRFVDATGGTALNYAGLTVFDASGRTLNARFASTGDGLRLTLDDSNAHYPLTIDPVAQQAYLKASHNVWVPFTEGDGFGASIAISDDTVVVGAPSEDSSAAGVNGDQINNNTLNAGAAYVFVRSGSTWSQQAYLKASNPGANDDFGASVAISGDTIIIRASDEDSNATGVNGNQGDNSACNSGAVYVFVRNGTAWSQQAYLKASNTEPGDVFGTAIAISGDTVVVGASREDSNATGVDGDQSSNGAVTSGAAYVFVRSGTSWSQQAYLKASNTGGGDGFGGSVSISGDTVVVGAPFETSNAVGVNGNQSNNSASSAGAGYVFVRSGTSWSQQSYLKASNTGVGDRFGSTVSIFGDTVVFGVQLEDSSATGVNGDQSDNSAGSAGAAYVFERSGTTWDQQAYLKASNTDVNDRFGWSVSMDEDTIVVGARFESSNATGVNGDQSDNSAGTSGAAYTFARSGTTWSPQAYLKASNTGATDGFGNGVSISGDTVVVGAPGEDSTATGVNGDQSDNTSFSSGAVYVYDLGSSTGAWSDQGCALAGVAGQPTLIGLGSLAAGTLNTVQLCEAAALAPCGLFVAIESNPVPFKGGTLKPIPFLSLIVLATDVTGSLQIPVVMPAGIPGGTEVWVQFAVQDAAAVHGMSLSNAIKGVTP